MAPWEHLEHLSRLGPRPIGSPSNGAAAAYITGVFARAGLAVEEQPYACTSWEHARTSLRIRGGENPEVDAEANAFSVSCDVTAPVVAAGTVDELEAVAGTGRILVLYGDLARTPLAPKSWFLKDERDDRIIRALEAMRPAAVLSPPTGTDYYGQLTEDWELDLPAATISPADARRILRLRGAELHLRIDAHRAAATARNIVGRSGAAAGRRIVVCAHFDTKFGTPGACDNGGGAATLLALAERLARPDGADGAPLPALEFVAFNGEEYLPVGDDEYLRRREGRLDDVAAAVNLDGVGLLLGAPTITTMSPGDEFDTTVRAVAARRPGVVWVDPWPESNHSTFAMRGIPSVALSSTGAARVSHYPTDTVDGLAPERLEEVAGLVDKIVRRLAPIS